MWTGDLKQTKMVRTGSSYLSQSYADELVFGLGSHSVADSVEIHWPTNGHSVKLGPAASGNTYIIYEKKPELLMAKR